MFRPLTSAAVIVSAIFAAEYKTQPNRPRYIVRDLGTICGPAGPSCGPMSFQSSLAQSINNQGMVIGGADTNQQDVYAPSCFQPSCYIDHAFVSRDGVLT